MAVHVNSLRPSDATWRQRTGSTLVQVMVWRQAITWGNAGLLSIGLLGTSFSEIWMEFLSCSFKKMHLKVLSAKMTAILFRGRWVESCHVVFMNVELFSFNGTESEEISLSARWHLNGLVQDCSISIADTLEILRSCTKQLFYWSTLTLSVQGPSYLGITTG